MTDMSVKREQGMNWHEVYREAIRSTKYSYQGAPMSPSKEQFMETFESFYDDILLTSTITAYPLDPPSCHREAKNRAATVWADDYNE